MDLIYVLDMCYRMFIYQISGCILGANKIFNATQGFNLLMMQVEFQNSKRNATLSHPKKQREIYIFRHF